MSYINTALINKLSKEVEDLKARLELMESTTKPQQKVGKITTSKAKDGLSGSTNRVAKGTHQSEPQAPLNTPQEAATDD